MKNIVLIFSLLKAVYFTFLFGICKMVDIMDIYKYLNISIGTAIKNPQMLKFIPDHLQTKKYVSMQIRDYLFYLICS